MDWLLLDRVQHDRETPALPATVFFEEDEWQALHAFIHRTPVLPETPPSLGTAISMVAKIGGFLGRKHDGADWTGFPSSPKRLGSSFPALTRWPTGRNPG